MKLRSVKDLPYNGNWSFNVMTYPTSAISNEEYNKKLKQASESFTFDKGDWLKKTILVSGENLNYILDDLEEQLKDKNTPEHSRQSIEAMLETFSSSKGSMEYCFIMHFGLPYTEDKDEAYQNMMEVRTGYEKKLNEMKIGTLLIKDESDILQIIDGIMTGDFYIGARLNNGKLIPVTKDEVRIKDKSLPFLAAPDDIESDPNGNYIYINNRTVASSVLVGRQNINISYQPNYKDDFYKNWSVEELINISKKENTAVIWCHVEIPISPEKHQKMFGERITKLEQSDLKNNADQMNSTNATFNKHAAKKLERNIKATIRGERYVYCALIGVVVGRTKANVDEVINAITVKLKDGGIKSIRPRRGHLFSLRMVLPTNYIHPEFLNIVTAQTSAALLPLRNTSALDEKSGPIFCRDALTKLPIRLCPSLQNQDAVLTITPTGNGKTGLACSWAGRVVDTREAKAYYITPKNENRNTGNTKGTDYKTFCEIKGGEMVDFGLDEKVPGLLVIPFDKTLFGNKIWAYQIATDMHYDFVENAVGAWLGKELTAGQKASQSTKLKKLYQDRKIIDADGKVINVKDWDDPTKIDWPIYEDIRDIIWETRNKKTNIIPNPSDRALYEATAKAGKGMPYWRYLGSKKRIQTEKDFVVFDLSGLPKNLSDAYCIYLMEYINLAYLPKDPDQPVKRVYVFWDEIHDLMENPITAPHLENGVRKGRAELVTNLYFTQDTQLPDDKFKTLKANCRNVFLMCNLNDTNVDEVMKAFNVDPMYREGLKRQGYEIGYLLRDGYTRDVQLNLTKFEKKYLFGEDFSEENSPGEPASKPVERSGLAVEECVQDLFEFEGFFTEDDVISGRKDDYEPDGYQWYNLQDPFSRGSVNCWILKSNIKPRDKPDNQDIIGPAGQKGVEGHIHYGACCMIYGWMKRHEYAFPNLRLNHTNVPDITWGEVDEEGNLINPENSGCIEFEGNGSHDLKDWNGKVNRAQSSGYKEIIFTGDSTTCREMKYAKPPVDADYINKVKAYIHPQGKQLLKKMEEIVTEYVNRKPANQDRLQAVTDQTEVY